MDVGSTSVVQVTNIAPQATKDQMNTLFSFVGRVDEVRLYPSVRDASVSIPSRCCFVRFADAASVAITLHLNNTVFIDRAIIITPVASDRLPEENEGLVMAMQVQQQQQQGNGVPAGNGVASVIGNGGEKPDSESQILSANPGLISVTSGGQIATPDTALDEAGLPAYPLLPADIPVAKVEEIRRTVTVVGLDSTISAQQCMEFFADHAGEVKYFRFCTRENDTVKYALVEFTDKAAVVAALNLDGSTLGMAKINIVHATEAIGKPQNKSSEAVQKEIEEAMTKVKEANCLVSAAVDPLMGMLGGSGGMPVLGGLGMGIGRSTRSRSRGIRSRSRDRRRRSRSRSRRRSRSRDRRRYRSRSRSRDRRRYRRSRSRSRDRRRRSRSRDRKKDEENGSHENGGEVSGERDRRRRSRSHDRRRRRSRSRSRRRRSRSRDRRRDRRRSRSRSKDRKRSRSKEGSKKGTESKVTRDYDQEEVGFEAKQKLAPIEEEGKNHGGEAPMEISDSP